MGAVEDPVPLTAAGMGSDGRLRRALAAFGGGGDMWDLVDAALAAVARDSPDELRARRDGIIERLYAGGPCRNCDAPPAPVQPRKANETYAAPAAASAFPASPDEEIDVDGLDEDEADASVENKILAIRDFLEDPDQVPKNPCLPLSQYNFAGKRRKRLTSSLQSVPLLLRGLVTVGGRDGEPAAEPGRHGHHLQVSPGQAYFFSFPFARLANGRKSYVCFLRQQLKD